MALHGYQRPDFFAHDHPFEIVRPKQVKNDDGHFVVHAKRKSRAVHHIELLLQGFQVGNLREAFGPQRLGRWLSFLMVWQIIFSAP